MTAATVLSTITGTSIAGRIIMGMASDWIGRKTALVICVSIEGIMMLWLINASSAWMLFLFAAVYGFCYGGHAPQLPALAGETLGLRHMGAIVGTASFFWGLGGALGTVLAGYAIDITGSYNAAFIIGALAMFLVVAISFILKTPDQKRG
jgi:MFS family permease